jgi:small-conductance mechanosensitive channel
MEIDFGIVVEQLQAILADFLKLLPGLVIGSIIFVLFYYAAGGVRYLVVRLIKVSGKPENLGHVLGRLSRFSFVVLGAFVALLIAFPDFSMSQLVQLLGLGGLAAGIAFRNIFEDFFAGILLLLNEPFRINDQIIVEGYEGTIENIGARTTVMQTYDGRQVVIPNAMLLTNPVIVNTAYPHRRVEYDVGIGYSDDIDAARRIIYEALDSLADVLKIPHPEVLVMELADSAVVLRVRWWINPPLRINALDSRDHVLQTIKTRLQQHGIDLPFPTQQILFHDQTEETDGNRRQQREGWPAGPGDIPRPQRMVDALAQWVKVRGRDTQ